MNTTGRIVAIALGLWFVVALVVGASGLYDAVPTPAVGATNGLLVTLTLLAVFLIPQLRAWVSKVPLQWLVLYHVVRFVGIAFSYSRPGASYRLSSRSRLAGATLPWR